jgi:hypothetical protein
VSSVTNTSKMFTDATVFIQYIVFWDVSNVTNVNSMFEKATFFNNDIAFWDVSYDTWISLFSNARSFNQTIGF